MTTWEEFEKDLSDFNRQMDEKNERKLRETIARRQAEARAETGRPPAPALGPPPSPVELDLRDRFLKTYLHTAYGQGEFHRYDGGLWHPLPLAQVRAEVFGLAERVRRDGLHLNSRLINAVVELLRLSTAVDDASWEHEPHLLPLANGVYDLVENYYYSETSDDSEISVCDSETSRN
jgi:hypothetical protein